MMKKSVRPAKTAALLSPLTKIMHATFLLLAALLYMMLVSADAWATQQGMADVTKNVGRNIYTSVPFLPMLSYVLGTWFTASGLLKLKDWVTDGDRNPLPPALVRLVIATFLILLPHTIRLTTGTFFARADGSMNVNVKTPAPWLGAFCKSTNPNCR